MKRDNPAADEETTLIRTAQEGCERAYRTLFLRHRSRVASIVAWMAEDADDLDDLVQLTFARAFRSLGTFRGQSTFATWVTRIALNVGASHVRARKARSARLDEAEGVCLLPGFSEGEAERPDDILDRARRRDIVRAGIAQLPQHYRRVVWLRYIREWSYEEIVADQGIPVGTLKTWLHRGRARLREVVGADAIHMAN